MRLLNVSQVVGRLLLTLAFAFLIPAFLAYVESEDYLAFIEAFGTTFVSGLILFFVSRKATIHFSPKEGFATVVFSWILLCIFGSLPYALMDLGVDNFKFADAMFETVSGFTTTGASVIRHIEAMPKSLLLWRSLTQWIGGMGIIVLFLAILPMLGAGGFQLFRAEIPGPTKDKLSPKVRNTAIYLWMIYLGLTGALFLILFLSREMNWFDSLCHAFTTISTGGYSTKDTSIEAFHSWKVDLIITIFMFLSSCNFVLLIQVLKGNFYKISKNSELRLYLFFVLSSILFITIQHRFYVASSQSWINSLRQSAFQVVTIISSTGFATDDFDLWTPVCHVVILYMMLVGGCAGSTSGGMKIFRVMVMLKVALKEIRQVIHPRALLNIQSENMQLGDGLIRVIHGFICLYFMAIIFSTFLLIFFEGERFSGIGLVSTSISCISNIGPGLMEFGPTDNYYKFSDCSKYWLSFLMLLGRLEIYSVLVLFHPDFWKR